MAELLINGNDVSPDLLTFAQELVRLRSFSGQEEKVARAIAARMKKLGYDQVIIDRFGNILGRLGNTGPSLMFESHTDTVQVYDGDHWEEPPFSGTIRNSFLWGRGSVDMKSAIAASVYAPRIAKDLGWLENRTVYVSCSVFEEDCDGEGVKHMMQECRIKPDFAVICEPSANNITNGHKGKAQIIIRTNGVSAHGSAPEKGVNAVYEMAEIIQRVEQINLGLMQKAGHRGSLVLSHISSTGVSLNAVPSDCEIYLDRRLALGETQQTVLEEINRITSGKNAEWKFDTIHRTTWTGEPITYQPLHLAWKISSDHPLTLAAVKAFRDTVGVSPRKFEFWDFSTNAVALVSQGIPCIGFGPGDPKLAHMRNERCAVDQIINACAFYTALIGNI